MAKASDIEYKEFENLTHLADTTHTRKGKHYDIRIFKDDKNDKVVFVVSGTTKDDKAGGYMIMENISVSMDRLVDDFAANIG